MHVFGMYNCRKIMTLRAKELNNITKFCTIVFEDDSVCKDVSDVDVEFLRYGFGDPLEPSGDEEHCHSTVMQHLHQLSATDVVCRGYMAE